MTKALIRIILTAWAIAWLVCLPGCSSFSYTSPDGTSFKRASLGNKLALKSFEMASDTNGMRKIVIKSLSNDQVEALGIMVEAAVTAALKAAAK